MSTRPATTAAEHEERIIQALADLLYAAYRHDQGLADDEHNAADRDRRREPILTESAREGRQRRGR